MNRGYSPICAVTRVSWCVTLECNTNSEKFSWGFSDLKGRGKSTDSVLNAIYPQGYNEVVRRNSYKHSPLEVRTAHD